MLESRVMLQPVYDDQLPCPVVFNCRKLLTLLYIPVMYSSLLHCQLQMPFGLMYQQGLQDQC